MATKQQVEATRIRHVLYISVVTVLVMLVPLVAMQFSEEVDWAPMDFLAAGMLVFGTGLAYELLIQKFTSKSHRLALGVILGGLLLLVWAQLAVGIF